MTSVGGPQLKKIFLAKLPITVIFSQGVLMGMNYHPAKNQISKMAPWPPVISGKVHFCLLARTALYGFSEGAYLFYHSIKRVFLQ